jgi:hypothetical protein
MKRSIVTLLCILLALTLFAQGAKDDAPSPVVASTSWTAAFADLAGIDAVPFIAPATLAHPPEYEITVSDVVKINRADYFVYAGYERMMQSMGDAIARDGAQMVQIHTDNSVENVQAQAKALAAIFKTEEESERRVAAYIATVERGKEAAAERGLNTLKVYCHEMQTYLARDLGLEIGGTFGPGPISAAHINEVAKGGYDIIIDNIHNPIASPLVEVSPSSRLVIWRNFPEDGGPDSLRRMVESNINALLE